MRFVEVAARLPQRCAFIPFIGSHHERGYFMGDCELPGGDTPYVSVVAVLEMARMLGMEPAGQSAAYERALVVKDAEIADLQEQLAKAREKLNAVEVLKSAGFTQARRPGRPSKQKTAA